MTDRGDNTLREALRLAVEQRDRAVNFLLASGDLEAQRLGEELNARKGSWVGALMERVADAPLPPPKRVLSLVPTLARHYREEQGSLQQRLVQAEAQLEAARYVTAQILPLALFVLVQATGTKVPYGFAAETYEEARRLFLTLEHQNPHRLNAVLDHLDRLAADYPTSLGELWQALRAFLKVPPYDPA
jgi:hypothetical protein